MARTQHRPRQGVNQIRLRSRGHSSGKRMWSGVHRVSLTKEGIMHRMTTPLLTLFLAAVAHAQAPAKPPSTEDAMVVHVADAKWAPPKAPEIPAGAVALVIAVDPNTGASIAYAKFPAGY